MADNLIRIVFFAIDETTKRTSVARHQLHRFVHSFGQSQHVAHVHRVLIHIECSLLFIGHNRVVALILCLLLCHQHIQQGTHQRVIEVVAVLRFQFIHPSEDFLLIHLRYPKPQRLGMRLLTLPHFEQVSRIVIWQNLEAEAMILEELLIYHARQYLRYLPGVTESLPTFLNSHRPQMVAIVNDNET